MDDDDDDFEMYIKGRCCPCLKASIEPNLQSKHFKNTILHSPEVKVNHPLLITNKSKCAPSSLSSQVSLRLSPPLPNAKDHVLSSAQWNVKEPGSLPAITADGSTETVAQERPVTNSITAASIADIPLASWCKVM
jgi:hypothetical protein